jgi:Flp pilus assembly protein TadD
MMLILLTRAITLLTVLTLIACAGAVKNQTAEIDPLTTAESKQIEMRKTFNEALQHQENKEYSEAKVIYKGLLVEDETLISPLVNLGVIAVAQQDLKEAKKYFEKAVELDPNNKQSLNYLGYISRYSGEFDTAEAYYRKILVIDPNDQRAVRNLGVLLDLYRGRLEEALALYEQYQSLQAEPDPKVKDWIFDTKNRLKVK